MDKSVIKRIKITYGIFTSLLLVGLLLIASCSLLLALSDKIAYADSSNGIVDDNLIMNSDFSSNSQFWAISFFDNFSFDDNGFNFTTDNWSVLEYKPQSTNMTYMQFGHTYTAMVYIGSTLYTGTYSFPNVAPSSDFSYNFFSHNSIPITCRAYWSVASNSLIFTIDINTSSSYSNIIHYVKLEEGSSFTGYVPKDYKNYGYEQGYNQGYLENSYNDMPINFYSPSYYSQQLGFLSSSYSLDYNGVSYSADFDQYYEVNNVYRSEYTKVNGKNPIIHFNIPLNSNRFSISFGIDIHSNYSNLSGVLLVGNNYTYYYDVASNNSLFNSNVISSNRCIYYTLNINLDYLDSYYINLLFDNSGSVGSCIVLPIVVSSTDVSSRANPTELGYNAGYDDGNRYGYNNGYSDGYNVGYNNGFDNGSDGSYSWYSLFGAIYDVPINAFNGMFDLNILGINLKGFILGLISLCIVLFILKIVFK